MLMLLRLQSMLTDFAAADQSKRLSAPLSLHALQIVQHIRFLVAAIKSNKTASADQSGRECNRPTTAMSCTTLAEPRRAGHLAWHTSLARGFALVQMIFSGAAQVACLTREMALQWHVCGM